MKTYIAAAAIIVCASIAQADDMVSYTTDQSFDDVTFGLENAIIDAGLVVDHVSHTGDMLERTRADVGSDVVIFEQADIYSFCSAQVSREVMEADWQNVMFCPYTIFVAVRPDAPDETVIGFRSYPDGAMKKVEAMLDGIARTAIGLD
ncbi:DUF302 domain-containing protein [Pseudooceanicola sp. MF1-13]|uniref:DUF302 domain-containing protein n=1 Tax=Pseudooceanicola sp. MF1-13 TaxID=3379095 RepID=UPI0038925122